MTFMEVFGERRGELHMEENRTVPRLSHQLEILPVKITVAAVSSSSLTPDINSSQKSFGELNLIIKH